ncbi:ParB/RepB/Spo0J family partition protein [Amaricoccus sp. W119]|uniref:ParB/RepB/Spo0J family partition protein n=1 Tax=Amaricoccus sp. W119 TaxID=3391833 RepID=UPI0039A709DD
MARRKRVEAPSIDELRDLEQGFATKPASNPFAVPPIAQVAGEAAAASEPLPAETRVEVARDRSDAEALRAAREAGRLIAEIPVSEILVEELTRDRMALDREEMDELKISIRANGLRLPVEVFELPEPPGGSPDATGDGSGEGSRGGVRYGLISGLRRVTAVRELYGPGARIAALVRAPRDAGEAIAAMVEENEVRANLSHYERGRIAALAVGQGRFADLEESVARLFASASKAKRSKIRSFALVHEELGDMLSFPQALTEKGGLRLANTLRMGYEAALRAALAEGQGVDPASEWEAMLPVIEQAEAGGRVPSRGGRPRKEPEAVPVPLVESFELANGAVMRHLRDSRGHVIRLEGPSVSAELVREVMGEIQRLLGPGKRVSRRNRMET